MARAKLKKRTVTPGGCLSPLGDKLNKIICKCQEKFKMLTIAISVGITLYLIAMIDACYYVSKQNKSTMKKAANDNPDYLKNLEIMGE